MLGALEEVTDLDSIEIGVHGLIAMQGSSQGLLLPQVPVEWNWNREKFIQQTCVKAGLKEDAHLDESTKFFKFAAEVFSESDLAD